MEKTCKGKSLVTNQEKAVNAVLQCYKPGISRQEICDITGLAPARVSRICHTHNLVLRDARMRDETLETKICQMLEAGKTRKEISTTLGINLCVIHAIVYRKHPELKKYTHKSHRDWNQIAPVVQFMINHGASRKEIAKTLQLSPVTVSLIISQHLPEQLQKRKYSTERIDTIKNMLIAGKRRQEIAHELGIPINSVYALIAKYFPEYKQSKIPAIKDIDKVADIVKLRSEGKKFSEISKMLDLDRDRTYRLYRKYALK